MVDLIIGRNFHMRIKRKNFHGINFRACRNWWIYDNLILRLQTTFHFSFNV